MQTLEYYKIQHPQQKAEEEKYTEEHKDQSAEYQKVRYQFKKTKY